MNPRHEERLLKALLADDALEQVREASLAGALAEIRRRRRRRTAISTVAGSLALALLVILISGQTGMTIFSRRGPVAETTRHPPAAKVKVIDDEQLFALFPEQAVALLGSPGGQRFLVLTDRSSPGAEAKKH